MSSGANVSLLNPGAQAGASIQPMSGGAGEKEVKIFGVSYMLRKQDDISGDEDFNENERKILKVFGMKDDINKENGRRILGAIYESGCTDDVSVASAGTCGPVAALLMGIAVEALNNLSLGKVVEEKMADEAEADAKADSIFITFRIPIGNIRLDLGAAPAAAPDAIVVPNVAPAVAPDAANMSANTVATQQNESKYINVNELVVKNLDLYWDDLNKALENVPNTVKETDSIKNVKNLLEDIAQLIKPTPTNNNSGKKLLLTDVEKIIERIGEIERANAIGIGNSNIPNKNTILMNIKNLKNAFIQMLPVMNYRQLLPVMNNSGYKPLLNNNETAAAPQAGSVTAKRTTRRRFRGSGETLRVQFEDNLRKTS